MAAGDGLARPAPTAANRGTWTPAGPAPSAGTATGAKLPGSAYRCKAEPQSTITRQPWIGVSFHQRWTAIVGFESIVETGETVPVPSRSTGGEPPRTVPVMAPGAVGVPALPHP
ncbi:hypothetical protein ACFQ1I_01180 [Kitasatospora arboriphila]